MRRPILLPMLLLWCAITLAAQAPSLPQVLALLDQAGPAFRDMSATLVRTDYTPVLKETEVQRGLVRLKRTGPREIRMLVEFKEPDPQVIAFERNEAQKYYPKLQLVEIYELGKYRSLKDQFLLLGFGVTGKELQKNYEVKVVGSEQIAGQQTTRLELIPRSKEAQEVLKRAELWITPAGYPAQQRIYTTSVEYTFTYSDVRLNTGLADADLKIRLPGNVKRQRMLR
ncbi:MAG: outer-membrane lipoprotein carrier protein LolA [Bryobacteraceae bacterium]|nr:outer-membrane lipoprotein carrier protein LolA [Bryobacteraceae bacterium]